MDLSRSPYMAFCQLETAFMLLKRSQRREIARCDMKTKELIQECLKMATSDYEAATKAVNELLLKQVGKWKAKMVIRNRIIKDCETEMAACRLILSFFE